MSEWRKVENKVNKPGKQTPKTEKSESNKTKKEPIQEMVSEDTYNGLTAAEEAESPEQIKTAAEAEASEELPSVPAENPAQKQSAPSSAEDKVPSSAWEATDGNTAVLSPRRYTAEGRRRGTFRFASLLGLIVLLLAAVGLVSLVFAGIKAIEKSQDTTALRTELGDFLNPVFQYTPSAFTNVNDSKQDALLLSAIYRVTEAERIRQLRASTSVCAYELDDEGRMLIPVSAIEASYKVLYGPDAKIYNHTIGQEGLSFTFEYDSAKGFYHIPSVSSSSIYVAVIDTLKKKSDSVILRVGFVSGTKVGYDTKGNMIQPAASQADYYQLFTVKHIPSGKDWMLVSVKDDGGNTTGKTAASTTGKSTGSTTASSAKTTAAAATTTKATTKAATTAAK